MNILLVNKIIIHHEKKNIYIILSIHRFPTDQISYLASRSLSRVYQVGDLEPVLSAQR